MVIGLIALAVVWAACGVVAAGYAFAYFQRGWESIADETRHTDVRFARAMMMLGPVALIVVAIQGANRHGWEWPTLKD